MARRAKPEQGKQPRCPICRQVVRPDHRLFPFCSERCKLVDLGRWLDGRYAIEVPAEATGRDAVPGNRSPNAEGAEK